MGFSLRRTGKNFVRRSGTPKWVRSAAKAGAKAGKDITGKAKKQLQGRQTQPQAKAFKIPPGVAGKAGPLGRLGGGLLDVGSDVAVEPVAPGQILSAAIDAPGKSRAYDEYKQTGKTTALDFTGYSDDEILAQAGESATQEGAFFGSGTDVEQAASATGATIRDTALVGVEAAELAMDLGNVATDVVGRVGGVVTDSVEGGIHSTLGVGAKAGGALLSPVEAGIAGLLGRDYEPGSGYGARLQRAGQQETELGGKMFDTAKTAFRGGLGGTNFLWGSPEEHLLASQTGGNIDDMTDVGRSVTRAKNQARDFAETANVAGGNVKKRFKPIKKRGKRFKKKFGKKWKKKFGSGKPSRLA